MSISIKKSKSYPDHGTKAKATLKLIEETDLTEPHYNASK